MTIRYLADARQEIDEAAAYYEAISPGLGQRFRLSVRDGVRQLNVGWVRRGFLRRNPTNPIFLLNTGLEYLGLLGGAIKLLTQPT